MAAVVGAVFVIVALIFVLFVVVIGGVGVVGGVCFVNCTGVDCGDFKAVPAASTFVPTLEGLATVDAVPPLLGVGCF